MKNNNAGGKSLVSIISLSFFLMAAFALNSGCKKINPEPIPVSKGDMAISARTIFVPSVPDTPKLVVWIKPGNTLMLFNKWLLSVRTIYGEVTVRKQCESCGDNPLFLLDGPGILTYIAGKTASGGTSPDPASHVSGEDGPIYYSLNFPIKYKLPKQGFIDNIIAFPSPIVYSGGTVKVAVLDTGIDPYGLNNSLFLPDLPYCKPEANGGWNFRDNNNLFMDDNNVMHGSTVSRFIMQQAANIRINKVQILTAKTHDRKGVSDLFAILCAFAYAKEMGVRMINTSFGFYLPRLEKFSKFGFKDPNTLLLREFVKYYLTKNKILLIAAAGNLDIENAKATFDRHMPFVPGLTYPSDWRDLDQLSFYPASLARDPAFPNVIAVTTVDKISGTVSPGQNYSRNVVDIGVNADQIITGTDGVIDYYFKNPRSLGQPLVAGSSYATPIVAGKLCEYYKIVQTVINKTGGYTKKEIWDALGTSTVPVNLSLKVIGGRYMNK